MYNLNEFYSEKNNSVKTKSSNYSEKKIPEPKFHEVIIHSASLVDDGEKPFMKIQYNCVSGEGIIYDNVWLGSDQSEKRRQYEFLVATGFLSKENTKLEKFPEDYELFDKTLTVKSKIKPVGSSSDGNKRLIAVVEHNGYVPPVISKDTQEVN